MKWINEIAAEMKANNDSWDNLRYCTLTDKELSKDFRNYTGSPNPFTLWTDSRVYFSIVYDCEYSVGSIPRYPCSEAQFFGE